MHTNTECANGTNRPSRLTACGVGERLGLLFHSEFAVSEIDVRRTTQIIYQVKITARIQ